MMRKPNNYKFFIEINTIKIHVQTILNRLRKQKDPNITNAIKLIIDEKWNSSVPTEIEILDSLLNHPERCLKNIDTETQKVIYAEIKKILENFIVEFSNETASSMPVPKI